MKEKQICKNCKYRKLLLWVENHDGTKCTFSPVDEFIWCTKIEHPYRYTDIACSEFKSIFNE